MDKMVPFPQADDFNKIVLLLNIKDESMLKDNDYLCNYLGDISTRQIGYYLAAAKYLGLINNREFTEQAKEIRELNSFSQNIALMRIIVSDKVIGEVYFTQKAIGFNIPREDVIDIMKRDGVKFESDAMYIRRSQTVMSWIQWIEANLL